MTQLRVNQQREKILPCLKLLRKEEDDDDDEKEERRGR
jgi:hypothetical protein